MAQAPALRSARYLPGAEADLLEQAAWYENQEAGLGDRMVAAVTQAVSLVRSNPEAGKPWHVDTRRFLVRGFPLNLIYRLARDEVVVIAVAHQRRDANYWIHR